MAETLIVTIGEASSRRLRAAAEERSRSVSEMAACAIEEAAFDYWRPRKDDPGRGVKEPPVDPFFIAEASGEIE